MSYGEAQGAGYCLRQRTAASAWKNCSRRLPYGADLPYTCRCQGVKKGMLGIVSEAICRSRDLAGSASGIEM